MKQSYLFYQSLDGRWFYWHQLPKDCWWQDIGAGIIAINRERKSEERNRQASPPLNGKKRR